MSIIKTRPQNVYLVADNLSGTESLLYNRLFSGG